MCRFFVLEPSTSRGRCETLPCVSSLPVTNGARYECCCGPKCGDVCAHDGSKQHQALKVRQLLCCCKLCLTNVPAAQWEQQAENGLEVQEQGVAEGGNRLVRQGKAKLSLH